MANADLVSSSAKDEMLNIISTPSGPHDLFDTYKVSSDSDSATELDWRSSLMLISREMVRLQQVVRPISKDTRDIYIPLSATWIPSR